MNEFDVLDSVCKGIEMSYPSLSEEESTAIAIVVRTIEPNLFDMAKSRKDSLTRAKESAARFINTAAGRGVTPGLLARMCQAVINTDILHIINQYSRAEDVARSFAKNWTDVITRS